MKFTEDDLVLCWPLRDQYFLDVLNGTHTVEEAREELASLVGSKYNPRNENCIKSTNIKPAYNGLYCSVCGEKQYDTPSGVCCANYHGGVEGINQVDVLFNLLNKAKNK